MSSAPFLNTVQQVVTDGLQNGTHDDLLTPGELDSLAAVVPILLKRYDVTGTCTYISVGSERFTSKPREWFIGRNLENYDAYPDEFLNAIKGSIGRILPTGEPQIFETTLEKPWGTTRRLHHHCPERNRKGEIVSVLSASFDITEKYNSWVKLERAVQEQRHFLAMMAHELRNPLAAVMSGLETLDRCPAENVAKKVRGTMHREITHITRLISDLVDITRLETGVLQCSMKPHDLTESLQLACSITQPVFRNAEQTLLFSDESSEVIINGDSCRLAQAVSNLLHNASKFSSGRSTIELSTRVVGEVVQIDVSDHGRGIPVLEQERIFQRYQQCSSVASSEHSGHGLGLGLYVSREILRQHGGELELVTSSLEGSLFRISIPVCRERSWDTSLNDDMVQQGISAGIAEGKESVLIVDDNAAALDLLTVLLELEGHTVYSASTAVEGEALFAAHNPSVVLLDVGLPDIDGRELAQRIRVNPDGKAALLVAVTGWATEEDTQKSLAAGFDVHLAKPVSVEALLALFKKHGAR
jgi:signal transduction histidine kinase/CheY-like chemotaxis protein